MASPSPYRTPARSPDPPTAQEDDRLPDMDLVPVFAVYWILASIHVGATLLRHATFGAAAAFYAVSCLLLPLLLKDTIVVCVRQLWRAMRRLVGRPFDIKKV